MGAVKRGFELREPTCRESFTPRGHERRNTVPSDRTGRTIRLLTAGCDTLYWSARADVTDALLRLNAAKAKAIASGIPEPWTTSNGLSLEVLLSAFTELTHLDRSRSPN